MLVPFITWLWEKVFHSVYNMHMEKTEKDGDRQTKTEIE